MATSSAAGQTLASPSSLREGSVTGQGSSEYLILLGVVLIIGLVVVGLLMFYPGTAGDMKQTQSDLYWQTAKPIAVREAYGSTIDYKGYGTTFPDTLVLILKNTDSDKITIRNISVNGLSERIDYGTNKSTDDLGHVVIGPSSCELSEGECSIELYPGKTLAVQVVLPDIAASAFCNQPRGGGESSSANSIRKVATVGLKISYERRGITKAETGNLSVQCMDYWLCENSQQCSDKYGAGTGAVSCEPPGCIYVPE